MALESLREKLAEMAARRAADRLHDDEALRDFKAEHDRRLAAFRGSVAHLMTDVLQPRMSLLAEYFDDVNFDAVDSGWGVRMTFNTSRRIQASVHLEVTLLPAVDMNQLHVLYRLEIIPILTEYPRVDEIVFPLDDVDEERLAAFVEEKLVGFMETYLLLEKDVAYHPHVDAVKQESAAVGIPAQCPGEGPLAGRSNGLSLGRFSGPRMAAPRAGQP